MADKIEADGARRGLQAAGLGPLLMRLYAAPTGSYGAIVVTYRRSRDGLETPVLGVSLAFFHTRSRRALALRVARCRPTRWNSNLKFTGLTHNFPVDPAV